MCSNSNAGVKILRIEQCSRMKKQDVFLQGFGQNQAILIPRILHWFSGWKKIFKWYLWGTAAGNRCRPASLALLDSSQIFFFYKNNNKWEKKRSNTLENPTWNWSFRWGKARNRSSYALQSKDWGKVDDATLGTEWVAYSIALFGLAHINQNKDLICIDTRLCAINRGGDKSRTFNLIHVSN